MNQEHFGLIVCLATIGAFLLELAKVLYAVCKKLSSRRMARKGERRYERAIGGAPSPRATHVVWFSRAGAATMGSSYRSLRCPTPHAREGAPQCRMLHQ